MSKWDGTAPVGRRGLPTGVSLIEVTVAMALTALIATMSAPAMAASIDAGRARQAAQFLAAQCRSARVDAVSTSANAALVFDKVGARWRMQRCVDGNSNGVRRADIARGRDVCDSSVDIGELFSGVSIAVDAALPDPDGGPGTSDPVRFGSSDLASFTPAGTATAGTVYLRSSGGAQFAVRVAGVTGRTRVLRYEPTRHAWMEV